MKRLILLTFMAMAAFSAKAQNFIPWQNTPQGATIASIGGVAALAEGNVLTVAYNTSSKIEVKQYNGLSWTPLPSPKRFGLFATDSVREIVRFQGDLYMISQMVLWKLTGQTWTVIQAASSGSYEDIEVYNGQLVFGGFYNILSTTNLYTYDGSTLGSLPAMPGFLDFITGIQVVGNDLFVSVYNNTPFGTGQKGLVKYDGTTWKDAASFIPTGSAYSGKGLTVFELKNKLYLVDITGVSEVRNDSIIQVSAFASPMSNFSLIYGYPEIEVHNDTAYLGWRYKPAAQLISDIKIFTGSSLAPVPNSPATITGFKVYQNNLLAFGPGFTSNVNGLSSMIWAKGAPQGILSVDLFWDQNTNCQKDIEDTTVLNQFISLNNGQIFFASAANQILNLPPGTYTIDTVYAFNKFGRHVTPSCTWPASFSITTQQQTDLKLPLALQAVNDLSIDVVGTRGWRSLFGFKEGYFAIVRNLGGNTQSNVTVTFNYDPRLSFYRTQPPATITGQGTASWTIPQIKPLEQLAFFVELSTNGSFSLSDSLIFTGSVSDQGDVYPQDNKDTTVQWVVGAFDPNDKQASANKVLYGTKRVDYHINFQNTGTDTAYKVTVVDTLDMTLPITKIVINSASHPYTFSVEGNVLIWEFDNIMLPDSGADYAGSQGYVRFSAGINPGLFVGDTIDNDAEIYFDYQNPVHTNHAKTAIVAWLSQGEPQPIAPALSVYPNPARDVIHIFNPDSYSRTVQLLDGLGRQLASFEISPFEEQVYPINSLPTGLYYIRSGSAVYRIVIVD